MNNFEKYEKTIMALVRNGENIAVVDGKPVSCFETHCNQCEIHVLGRQCKHVRKEWFDTEYVEKPKLTKQERKFCELFTYKNLYIARDNVDCYETLHCYEGKPQKHGNQWEGRWFSIEPMMRRCRIEFSFIKGTDEEPWAVSDLLKLEVIE